jgi:phage-related protein
VVGFIAKWHPIAVLFRAVKAAWPAVSSWIGGVAGKIISGLSGLASNIVNWLKRWNPVSVMYRAVTTAWPTISSWLKGIGGKIKSAIGNLGSLLFNVGKSILMGLLDGLKSAWKTVSGWVGNVGGWIRGLKGPAERDKVLLTENGQFIMGGLLAGLKRSWPQIQKFVSGRALNLESAFGEPTLAVSGIGAMAAGSLVGFNENTGNGRVVTLLSEQNVLLRKILAKTGFSIDGRDMVDAIGKPLVDEIRQRTGL